MRQIDNMTPAELETLSLKGMLGTKAHGKPELPSADYAEQLIRTHIDDNEGMTREERRYIAEALKLYAHAEALAEALRELCELPNKHRPERIWDEARKALAAWEGAQK